MHATLTSRQRMEAALAFRPVDRVPLQINPSMGGLHEHGRKLLELMQACGHDFGPFDGLSLPQVPATHFDADGRYHHVATDDCSMGEKGTVVQHSVFSENLSAYSAIYACGPDPMMRAVAKGAELQNIPCEVSLENTMACGMGACLCCVVETTEGNKTTCVEGPIFDTRSLTWKTKTH